ncbi:MAG: hypothetical protein RBS07_12510 [Lentimicrobium sp.]|jgi:hypothetical protein|nr:hypothetical protein [Lentimicrobium sp.]
MRKIFIAVMISVSSLCCTAQNSAIAESLLPMGDVNQKIRKVRQMVSDMGMMVRIEVFADLNSYTSCNNGPEPAGRLDLELTRYNTNDETGKMMLQMLHDMNGIEQMKESFKHSSGMDVQEAREEQYLGGTLWIITNQNECINAISGPTGVTAYQTIARYFLFQNSTIFQIDIDWACKPAKAKEMISHIIEKSEQLNFTDTSENSDN